MILALAILTSLTARWARVGRRDSMSNTARRLERGQRAEPSAEPGSAGREPTAVRGVRGG
jgi:hypothetical protein